MRLMIKLMAAVIFTTYFNSVALADHDIRQHRITTAVNKYIEPLMRKYQIPGIAVAIVLDDKIYFFNYGVLSHQSQKPVTQYSLFGIGSITKLFTATLAAYLNQTRQIDLNTPVSSYLPTLKNSPFDRISMINLLTHTATLPLFVPESVHNRAQFIHYLLQWKPKNPIGSQRIYSNVGFGLAGLIIQSDMGSTYEKLMRKDILIPLHLSHSYFHIPSKEKNNVAQGYAENGKALPLLPLSKHFFLPAAYGMFSSSSDLIHFLAMNMHPSHGISSQLISALQATQSTYYKTPFMSQGLGWEAYPYPITLQKLKKGQTNELSAKATKVNPSGSNRNIYLDKTGTGINDTFANYVAIIPSKKIGIVILANKFYPFSERPRIGYKIINDILKQ